MQEIHGTVMHYPWGTKDAIPAILGVPANGQPFAEYWLGAHPLAPSLVEGRFLDALVDADPSLLGAVASAHFSRRLPYLLKLLSAAHALSLQAHPSRDKAAEGYAREQASGIALDDPERIYKDDCAKPEMVVALSEFRLLVGFRPAQQTLALFAGLGVRDAVDPLVAPLNFRRGAAAVEQVFLDVLGLSGDRLEIINQVLVAAVAHAGDAGGVGDLARTIIDLDAHFPGDPGILAACLMNLVTLHPGQALFVPPGVMHAHLSGTCVEVQASSDNVVRGGLTSKHIAVDELVSVVDFAESTPEVLHGSEVEPGVWAYPSACPEFDLWRLEPPAGGRVLLPGQGSIRVALVTAGHVLLEDGAACLPLAHGQAVLLGADNSPAHLSGDGQVFLAAPGIR